MSKIYNLIDSTIPYDRVCLLTCTESLRKICNSPHVCPLLYRKVLREIRGMRFLKKSTVCSNLYKIPKGNSKTSVRLVRRASKMYVWPTEMISSTSFDRWAMQRLLLFICNLCRPCFINSLHGRTNKEWNLRRYWRRVTKHKVTKITSQN